MRCGVIVAFDHLTPAALAGHAQMCRSMSKIGDSSPHQWYVTCAQAGLDSLGAVELRNAIMAKFGISLSITAAFDHPTSAALAGHVAAVLAASQEDQYHEVSHDTHLRIRDEVLCRDFGRCVGPAAYPSNRADSNKLVHCWDIRQGCSMPISSNIYDSMRTPFEH